jgi:hypothetical protein
MVKKKGNLHGDLGLTMDVNQIIGYRNENGNFNN